MKTEYQQDIRVARKHGDSVVMTLTGFLIPNKRYLVKKENELIIIKEIIGK